MRRGGGPPRLLGQPGVEPREAARRVVLGQAAARLEPPEQRGARLDEGSEAVLRLLARIGRRQPILNNSLALWRVPQASAASVRHS